MSRLLPALQILSLVCLLFAALAVVAVHGPWSGFEATVGLVYAAAIPVVGVLWIARARQSSSRGRALLSLAVAGVLLPVSLLGAVGFTIPVLLTGAALVVVDVGRRAGFLTAVVVGIGGTILHLTSGNSVLVGLSNALPVVVLLGFGIALGSALRAYEDAHADDLRTIAQRDRALDRLQEAMERLRRTTEVEKELILADERARSARDLHDGLGHRFTLISMSLEFALRTRDRDPQAAWDEVGTAEETARAGLGEMRTWVRALSPVRDSDATGVAAFEAIAESFRGTGLEVVVETQERELELTTDASLLLYRTVQEGLTNALRHARPEGVRISLGLEGENVVLRLVNDLDETARQAVPAGGADPGFGLRGLADRASSLRGGLRAARVDDDFALEVRLPVALALEPEGSAPDAPTAARETLA